MAALLEVIIGSGIECVNYDFFSAFSGEDNKGCVVSGGTEVGEKFNAIHIRHLKIRDDGVVMACLQFSETFLCRTRSIDGTAPFPFKIELSDV